MFNHARTLLMNVDGSRSPGEDFPGEELIPVEFRRVPLKSYALDTLRSLLFGSSPDRAMLNFRVRQYLAILHCTELAEYVTALDPRLTYDAEATHDYALDVTYQPVVRQVAGPDARLLVIGDSAAPDASGKMYYLHEVAVTAPEGDDRQASVLTRIPRRKLDLFPITLTGGLTNYVALPGTGYQFCLDTDDPDVRFEVTTLLRPQWSLGQIAALLDQVGETVMLELFGVSGQEPWATFSNLWYYHPELPYRLGGVLLALIHRTEELRLGRQ